MKESWNGRAGKNSSCSQQKTNETSNNRRKTHFSILITLYFCSILIITALFLSFAEVLMGIIAEATPFNRQSIYSILMIIIADPHQSTLAQHHQHKKSFDDNCTFYYALRELFNIVFHKLALIEILCRPIIGLILTSLPCIFISNESKFHANVTTLRYVLCRRKTQFINVTPI